MSAAIFDLDGVLLDTEPLYTAATQSIVGEFGRTYGWDLKRRIMGGTALRGAEVVVRELELPISVAEYLTRRRRLLEQSFKMAEPIEGAERLVRSLVARGLTLAIATSSERALFELKIARHEWFSLFSAAVCGDDRRILHPKPAPDIFQLAARELGVRPHECIVFEDSPAGVTAAAAAGAYVVARRDPALTLAELAPAHVVVHRYAELNLDDLLGTVTNRPSV